ncbi:hypothetical protein BAUCODRAFT_456145 [Baudoinia panamericana UAMH 10762]|uniref:Uncharacterized protein n=1 Tax=Baudoinia panamericana (strain UAMH 10762) TaxID=717646 RepID=M2MLM1_BAUPA|nr:uncharacterized protein BAUCODRAFT_456145 [Baudoinia panamericana UAMH 10762]EMC97546.1 hypothetical protein BAUCODRAFT_456145 [Baudoinia panamericana UAMH 10762]
MVGINCFRSARSTNEHDLEAPRPRPRPTPVAKSLTKSSRLIRRHGSSDSRSSTCSNESISKLPPCSGVCDPKIDAMMMPVPAESGRGSCLRLSQPKTYSNIVDSMKACKGCRDWRNFAVFHNDEVDMALSAVEVAQRQAANYERKLRQFSSSSLEGTGSQSLEADLVC